MATLPERTAAAAELFIGLATEAGVALGYPKEIAAMCVLQEAFAISLVDAMNYGDDVARLQFGIDEAHTKLTESVKLQYALRKGHNPLRARYGG